MLEKRPINGDKPSATYQRQGMDPTLCLAEKRQLYRFSTCQLGRWLHARCFLISTTHCMRQNWAWVRLYQH
jgi:hypothetical protein